MQEEEVYQKLAALPRPHFEKRDWPDYLALGLEESDLGVLIDFTTDFYLSFEQTDEESAVSIHAWRAMVEIGGPAVAGDLISLAIGCDEIGDEWFVDELPTLAGKTGMEALPVFVEAIHENPTYSNLAEGVVLGIPGMVKTDADREKALETLLGFFDFEEFDRVKKALIVESLIRLKAKEAMPFLRSQFENHKIDVSAMGDLEEVEIAMGLRDKRETPKPNFQILEEELALAEVKALAGPFPAEGTLDEKLRYFLIRYGSLRSIKRIDELDGFLTSCLLANPGCSAKTVSPFVWDPFSGDEVWQSVIKSRAKQKEWESCLGEVLQRIEQGLASGDFKPYVLVWPDAEESMDPEAPYFTPWLEGFMQGEMVFVREDEDVEDDEDRYFDFARWAQEVFDKEDAGIRLLEDDSDNPMYLVIGEIVGRYAPGSGEGGFIYTPPESMGWVSPEAGLELPAVPAKKKKIERNDPCPCGSGRKYKKCCMN